MVEGTSWLTPPTPAAIALLRCPALPALLDVPCPAPGNARFGHLIDVAGAVVDEVVAIGDDHGLLLGTHGGPGLRAAVEQALAGHGVAVSTLAGGADRWSRLAQAACPAARDWLLTHGDDAQAVPPFDPSLLARQALVLITGPANAGKSSLLNAWCGHRRAVVSAQAGTTRDLVAAEVLHRGWRLRVMDSAGLRAAADAVERAGQSLVTEVEAVADVVIELHPGRVDRPRRSGALVVAGKADLRAQPLPALAWATAAHIGATRAEAMLAAIGDAVLARLRLPAS